MNATPGTNARQNNGITMATGPLVNSIAAANTFGGRPANSAPSRAVMDSAPQGIKLMPINARQIARPRLTTFRRSGTVRNIETPYPVSDSIITPIPTATSITVRGGERLRVSMAWTRASCPPPRLLAVTNNMPAKITNPTRSSRIIASIAARDNCPVVAAEKTSRLQIPAAVARANNEAVNTLRRNANTAIAATAQGSKAR